MSANRRDLLGAALGASAVALIPPRHAGARAAPMSAAMSAAVPAVPADETFDGTWPFRARFTRAAGYHAHYIDEGRGPETLLLLHGEPTWGYLFRPVGMGLAIRHPDRIRRIVSVNGPTPAGQPDLIDRVQANVAVSPWFQWILRAEAEGVLDRVLGRLHDNILSTLTLNGFLDDRIVTQTWLRAYRSPFPTPAHAAGGIGWAKGYAAGLHRFETPDAATRRALAAKPALAIWGEQDRTLRAEHFLPLFASAFPDGRIVRLAGAAHYSPEDAPRAVASAVDGFIAA